MNVKILDSWLRDYLKTNATPKEIGECLSLTSVSVERIEKYKNDFLYDIEVTTNRPDLMSVSWLAKEAAAVLPQFGINATYKPPTLTQPKNPSANKVSLSIKNDSKLIHRICAVVMEISIKKSPELITDRLESTDIRSLNNVIDITNYVMRTIGHPTHAMDYDRLPTKSLIIRESKKREQIKTLDNKTYSLPGGDIVADDTKGNIVDLIGIMGLEDSVITDNTKRIVFFINTDEASHIRKTSMATGIRTEAAVLNEKELDPELAYDALLYGIQLFEEYANGKIISDIIDIYPNKNKEKRIKVSLKRITTAIGVNIPPSKIKAILTDLGFTSTEQDNDMLEVVVPTIRSFDVGIEEDIIEEIARVYGYHNIPNTLPPINPTDHVHMEQNQFFWEDLVKDSLKYWGYTEVYTYPMVSEELFEGPLENAVALQNPLSDELTYMRRTLVPSLLKVVKENKNHESIMLFEIANVYHKKAKNLPDEKLHFAGVVKKLHASFYEIKGMIEQLANILGIINLNFKPLEEGIGGATIFIDKEQIGEIEILDSNLINFEIDFQSFIRNATLKKTYKALSKFPPIVEDLAIIAPDSTLTGDLLSTIQRQSNLIKEVSLLDKYQDTRTFHIVYQSYQKNLTDDEVGEIRTKILKALKEKLSARLKD